MRAKYNIYPIAFIVLALLYLPLFSYRFDLYIRLPYLGTYWATVFAQGLFFSVEVCLLVAMRKHRLVLLCMIVLMAVVFLAYFFPMTQAYDQLDRRLNQNSRQQTVEMLLDGTLEKYRIGEHAYSSPHRFASYNRKILVKTDGEDTIMVFFVYTGTNEKRVMVYATYGGEALGASLIDFTNRKYCDLQEVDQNWYFARLS